MTLLTVHHLISSLNLTDQQLSVIADSYPMDNSPSEFEHALHCVVIAELDRRSKATYRQQLVVTEGNPS